MNRPSVPRPYRQAWEKDEKDFKEVVDAVVHELYNFESWDFPVPRLQKKVTHPEIVKNLDEEHPEIKWLKIGAEILIDMPKYIMMKAERIRNVTDNLLLTLENYANLHNSYDDHIDQLEEEIQVLRETISKLDKFDAVAVISKDVEKREEKKEKQKKLREDLPSEDEKDEFLTKCKK